MPGGIFIQYLYFAFGLGELLLGMDIRERSRLVVRTAAANTVAVGIQRPGR